jgi:hypothetical protein
MPLVLNALAYPPRHRCCRGSEVNGILCLLMSSRNRPNKQIGSGLKILAFVGAAVAPQRGLPKATAPFSATFKPQRAQKSDGYGTTPFVAVNDTQGRLLIHFGLPNRGTGSR